MNTNCVLNNVHMRRTSSKSNVNCCVYGCNAVNKKNPELSFHRFPRAGQKVEYIDTFGVKSLVDKRKMWETNLKMGKTVTPYMQVCSLHFTNDDYITPNEDCYAKRFLKKTAIPTQNLPQRKTYTSKKRIERLDRRKLLIENPPKTDSDFIQTKEETLEAAEALLCLQQKSFEEGFENISSFTTTFKQFADCATQTKESSYTTSKKEVGIQVTTSWFSITNYLDNDKALSILTGIPSLNILLLLTNFFLIMKKDTRSHRLSIKEKILLVFLKLKLDLTYSALGILFGNINIMTVKRIFCKTVQDLADIMKVCIYFPSKENIMSNMPVCFQKYQQVRVVLDCTEVTVQTPRKLCCRIKLYSHYKKNHTLKFMTGVTPAGLISYVSPLYGGRASDKSIFEQSKLIEKLEPYVDQIMADKGFLIDKICEDYGIKLVRPPFLRNKKQFNKKEACENRNIASARVHIERANARIKIFKILRNTFPLHLVSVADNIIIVICAMVNLSSPIMREELFLK